MARSKLPTAKAKISGAAAKNPQRFRDRRPKRTNPIGKPYAAMTPAEKRAWAEVVRDMPWLHAAHRTLLQMVCRLKARLDEGQEVGVSAMGLLSKLLSKLGATPVDETKVSPAADQEVDPAEAFFSGRPH